VALWEAGARRRAGRQPRGQGRGAWRTPWSARPRTGSDRINKYVSYVLYYTMDDVCHMAPNKLCFYIIGVESCSIPGTQMLYFSPLIHRYLVTSLLLYYGSTWMTMSSFPKRAVMSHLVPASVMVSLMVVFVVSPSQGSTHYEPGANNPTAVSICWMLLQVCRSSRLIFASLSPV